MKERTYLDVGVSELPVVRGHSGGLVVLLQEGRLASGFPEEEQ